MFNGQKFLRRVGKGSVVLFCLTLLCGFPLIAAEKNLIKNPGFEIDANNDGKPDGYWFYGGKASKAVLDTQEKHSGEKSLKNGLSLYCGLIRSQHIKVTPDAAYRFSLWYKTKFRKDTEEGDNFTLIRINFKDKDNKKVGGAAFPLAVSSDWRKHSASVVAPSDADRIQIDFCHPKGYVSVETVWFDDFSLEKEATIETLVSTDSINLYVKLTERDISKIDVIPTPKQMRLWKEGIVISDAEKTYAVLIYGKDEKTGRTAASRINEKIKEQGGKSLPVLSLKEFESSAETKDKHWIFLGSPENNHIAKKYWIKNQYKLASSLPDYVQGYVIETRLLSTPGGAGVIFLAGSDAAGTYYAGITFAELLIKKDQKITFAKTSIRDWPSHTQYRESRRPGVEPDRFKLNLRYGRRGGDFTYRYYWYSLTIFPTYASTEQRKKLYDSWDCSRARGELCCFSRDKEMRENFRRYAQAAQKNKYTFMIYHFPDTDARKVAREFCPKCWARWGRDYASAYAHAANLIIEETRKVNKDIKLVFCLRPYSIGSIRKVPYPFERTIKVYKERIKFDENCYILAREGSADDMQAWIKMWGDMKQYFYLNILEGFPAPVYAYRSRYYADFIRERKIKVIYACQYRYWPDPVSGVISAERLWNLCAGEPGGWPRQNLDMETYLHPVVTSDKEKVLMDRVCNKLFGENAGHLIGEFYKHGLHVGLATQTELLKKLVKDRLQPAGLKIPDFDEAQKKNLQAAKRACLAIDKIVKEDIPVLKKSRKYIPVLYRLSHITLMFAEARVALIEVEKMVREGRDNDALGIARKTLARFKERKTMLDESDRMLRSWDAKASWKETKFSGANAINCCKKMEKILENYSGNLAALHSKIKVESASKELVNKPMPVVHAARVKEAISIDGRAEEDFWKKTKQVSDFVNTSELQYGRSKTEVMAAYDDENLYFFFKGQILQKSFPKALNKARDKWVESDSYFEFMISPDRTKGYFQTWVNPKGIVGDVYHELSEEASKELKNISWEDAQAIGESIVYPETEPFVSWQSEVRAAVRVQEREWSVELAIPFNSMKTGRFKKLLNNPKKGTAWRINLCRSIPASSSSILPAEYTSLTRAGFHDYMSFPKMIFE